MSESIFDKGLKVDISKHVERKGQFDYLSWAFAVRELRKLDPKATWEVTHFEIDWEKGEAFGKKEMPYMTTDCGYFVEVVVRLSDGTKSQQIHPVLDNRNQPIQKPNAFQINTSIQRCLTKAIALASGIGLNLYAGEDLPEEPKDDISIEEIIRYLPECKTIKSLEDYYKKNRTFIESRDDEDKAKIMDAFANRKSQIEGEKK